MEKKYFALMLLPPRPTFAQDMNDEERGIMQRHVAYWSDLTNKGFTIVYGPVLDPKGAYGLGVVQVDNEEEVNELIKNDPANGLNKYEIYPMLAAVPKK